MIENVLAKEDIEPLKFDSEKGHQDRTWEEIKEALERDKFMSAEEAKAFGLIDKVVEKRSS